MRLIFIGPPGAGKGTQAKLICVHFGILHLSTGDILRSELENNTQIGQSAQTFINNGRLVPDQVLLDMMSVRLAQDDCAAGYVLDGFPRTIPQAEGLDNILADLNQSLNRVINITADEEELINRLGLRGKSSGRADDSLNVIQKRLVVYRQQTAPMIEYYKQRDLVKTIDGIGSIPAITKRILSSLNNHD